MLRIIVTTTLLYTVKNVVYQNTPGEQYFTVSMVTHTVTTETVKYCSPGVFSYTAFFYSVRCFNHTPRSVVLYNLVARYTTLWQDIQPCGKVVHNLVTRLYTTK